jgi:flavorubredoxin
MMVEAWGSVKAVVLYTSRYGNTEKIARTLEAGLKEAGIDASCQGAEDCGVDLVTQYDLVCLGAPTEWLSAPKPMKEFIGRLKGANLTGKWGFAFDTKLSRPLSGSASGYIEKELGKLGLRVIARRESAIVYATGSGMSSMRLKDGEEQRFREIGRRIGSDLRKAGPPL